MISHVIDARLPQNFKTFDSYDIETKIAISAKTLNTMTASRLAQPERVWTSLKKSIDSAARFEKHTLSDFPLTSEMILKKHLEVAIPQTTTPAQWQQINRAMEYSKNLQ